ncbi:MAG: nitroreductase [Saprospiraceae bacterium]|nr:nitroreductase [Saprospiraceae bacterium]
MNPNDISLLIRKRRSVYPKNYSEEMVDNRIIREMLENGNWAPTHRLTEPWRFTVFEGEGLKTLADFQASQFKLNSEKQGTFTESKYLKLKNKPLACSHIIAIGMRRDPAESVPEIEEVAAVSCAVQNMWLTASAHGIGCYWSTGGVTYDPTALDFFGLTKVDKLLGFLMIGMPSIQPKASRRGPISDKVTWVTQ